MRGTLIFTALLLAAPVALAQDEPTVNDSDYDTTPPADDQTYLDDAEMESTAMSDSDFDTSVPESDTSYLDDAEAGTEGSGADAGADTPGVALVLLLAAVGALAIAWPRR